MLYLEDYLEMIEHLPQELRDRFTEMREMDLTVQNNIESLEKRVKLFFAAARRMKAHEKEREYQLICRDYLKTLEDADEKVALATQMHDLVERYLRKLDQELLKFKMELEADHRGITEILEKRSLEMDQPSVTKQQKDHYNFAAPRAAHYEKKRESVTTAHTAEKRLCIEKSLPVPDPRQSAAVSGRVTPSTTPANTSNVGYNLGHIGAGGNAIAAAASQAIAATQQMQQGRRTASLKASYEAINIGVHAHEFSIGKELAGAAQTAIAAIQETTKKQKKKSSHSSANQSTSSNASVVSNSVHQTIAVVEEPVATNDVTAVDSADPNDWAYDPNEPRYCICNQVSYGDMVACDNEDCPFEWFHYACVDVKAPPKGKWYCPQCTSTMRRRGSRKN